MKLAYAAPPADLSPYMSAYYLFESDAAEIAEIERADIAQVRFFLEGGGSMSFPDGRERESVPVTIIGPRLTASHSTIKGPMRVFGFGLQPAGWAALTKLPASDHVNDLIDAASLFGDAVTEIHARLRALDRIEDMAAIMNAESQQFYQRAEKVPHWFIRAVDDWLEARLSPDIADLETATGLSRRQIERLAKQLYGAPPKLLVRKYRALRIAHAITRGKGEWHDFIDDAYYDQSHFIREIKEFIGITPGAVREHKSPLTAMTFDRSQLMNRFTSLSAPDKG
jgi:AraC-like DNA-binding protein